MTAREQHDKAVEAFNNHDAERVVEFYAPDAILYDPQYNEPQNGRDAIRKDYEKMFSRLSRYHRYKTGIFS